MQKKKCATICVNLQQKISNVRISMKKQGPTEHTEHTEGHRTLCAMISVYFFCVFLCVRNEVGPY